MNPGNQATLLIAGIVVLLLTGLTLLRWDENRLPISTSQLDQLRSGMTTNEVVQIDGPPSSDGMATSSSGNLDHRWVYMRGPGDPWVTLHFNADGTFAGAEILQPHRDGRPPSTETYKLKHS